MPQALPAATALDKFARLWALGYRTIVPVIPPGAPISTKSVLSRRLATGRDSRGKTPGILWPDGWGSYYWSKSLPTEADMARYAAMGAGLGLVCTPESRLVGIDIDSLDPDRSGFMLGELKRRFPFVYDQVPLRFGKRPKFLTLMRVAGDEEIAYRRVEITCDDGSQERAELLCAGRYFNWDAIHPGTLKPYEHTGELPRFKDLPCVSLAEIDAFFRDIAAKLPNALYVAGKKTKAPGTPVNAERLKGEIESVRRAVRALPNDAATFPHYDDYIEVGYAIKGASQDWPEDGEDLWLEWSDRWDNGSNRAAAIDWQTLNNPRIGASWLNEKAGKLVGYVPHLLPIADEETRAEPAAPQRAAEPQLRTLDGNTPAASIPTRSWLVHPWCPAHTVSMIVGPGGASKSAFTLRLAAAVASNDEAILRGKERLTVERLHRSGPVLVFNREDEADEMARRLAGLQAFHGIGAFRHPIYVSNDLMTIVERRERGPIVEGAGALWLRTKIRELLPALVVLDPFASLSQGLEENSNADMQALADAVRRIAETERTTIVLVHHTGKPNGRPGDAGSARGASAIAWAMRGGLILSTLDVEDEAKAAESGLPIGRYVRAEGTKVNYGPKAGAVLYRLRSVPVGNGTGEPLPRGADILFEDGDAAGFLKRTGDTVAVHELVDTRGAADLALANRLKGATSKAHQVARIVLEHLAGRTSAELPAERAAIGERLREAGIIRGDGRNAVDDKLKAALAGAGVEVDREGQPVCVCMSKGEATTAPWILKVEERQSGVFA